VDRRCGRMGSVPTCSEWALCSLDGEKAEALSTLRTIPSVGSERSFRFSPTVQIARCQIAHHALLILSKLGQKLPFLTTDFEAHPAPLPVMSGGGDHGECACGGSHHRDCRHPSSHRVRMNASSSWASLSARWVFNLCQRLLGSSFFVVMPISTF
jgi:hypothetical protein